MSNFVVSSVPPEGWAAICEQHGLLFHSQDWTRLLESSFNARTQYLWDEAAGCGVAVSAFAAGPFKLGYIGFPYGGLVGEGQFGRAAANSLQAQRSILFPAAIRVPVSAFSRPVELDLPFASTPESAIIDLPAWSLEVTSGNHRRDVRKAIESDLEIVDAHGPDDGAQIFRIYADTLRRHRGGLRYNEAYFRGLVALAGPNPNVRVTLARRGNGVAGFTVVVLHGADALYLHGGIRLEYRQYQPSALLLHDAILWARDKGCRCFNMMSSPKGQKSLVWYKEKWGAETREHRTYTIPLRPSYRLFQVAERVYRLVR